MKKVLILVSITLLTLFMNIKINAEIKECTYKLSYGNNSDEITFYLDPGVGIQDKFKIKSTNKEYSFGTTGFAVAKGKIFNDKDFFIDTKQTVEYAFYDTNNKIVSSCPSILSYFDFGTGSSIFGDGYILCNFNYHEGSEGVLTKGSISQVKNDNDSREDKSAERKNCGNSFVFALNSTNNASDFKDQALIGQYYIENNTKYIELKLKRGTEEGASTTHRLAPEVGATLEIDYYKTNMGALPIKVETFDNCDNMPEIKTCKVDDSSTKIYIGTKCTNDANGDPDTEKKAETKEEYEKNYNNNYSSFEGTLPSPGFGKSGELCSGILGGNLSKVVKLGITILRIAGAIIAIVNGMISLIPAIMSKDPESLKKAGRKCMLMGCILLAIGVFPTILKFIAKVFSYDVSCIF